jgi:octaprenyl-diphosphate synthase
MHSSVKEIKELIASEIKEFEVRFKNSMKSNTPLLDKITQYIIKSKGKQMRPMFVFLTAKLVGKVTDSTYNAATLIELLHTATLVHDDVVDDSNERRGFFSVNALWKNKIAVLVGDYLLSRGLMLSADNNEFELLKVVSNAVREMSEGELLQIEKARKLNITEEVYFDIIRQKTASLLASCCVSGALSAGASKVQLEQMKLFGEYTGIAFQIKDDLFDYGNGEETGKPTGIDIKERKLTLPIIYTLNNSSDVDKRWIINTIKNKNENSKEVNKLIDFVKKSGGISYTKIKMLEYKQKALDILKTFPQNEANRKLNDLVIYTVERKK